VKRPRLGFERTRHPIGAQGGKSSQPTDEPLRAVLLGDQLAIDRKQPEVVQDALELVAVRAERRPAVLLHHLGGDQRAQRPDPPGVKPRADDRIEVLLRFDRHLAGPDAFSARNPGA